MAICSTDCTKTNSKQKTKKKPKSTKKTLDKLKSKTSLQPGSRGPGGRTNMG